MMQVGLFRRLAPALQRLGPHRALRAPMSVKRQVQEYLCHRCRLCRWLEVA